MEAAIWTITAALAVAFAYTTRFSGATLSLGRELSATESARGVQDAITPPWQTKMTLAVYSAEVKRTRFQFLQQSYPR